MPNVFLSVELERYKKMDDWVYDRLICEDCLRVIGNDPLQNGQKYVEKYICCDSGPWCPDNDEQFEVKK